MKHKLLILLVITCELFLDRLFSDFKSNFREQYHQIVLSILLVGGLMRQSELTRFIPSKFFQFIANFGPPEAYLLNSIFTVFVVKFVYSLISSSLSWILYLIFETLAVTKGLTTSLLLVFDQTPLWLIIASSDVILPLLASGTSLYTKFLFWWLVWLVGGYVIIIFALISAITGIIFKGRIK